MPIETVYRSSQDETPLVRCVLHEKEHIWVLYLAGQDTKDNRLTHALLRDGLAAALRDVRRQWYEWVDSDEVGHGAALITSAELSSKIFSNGLDLFNAMQDPYFFNECLNPVFWELLSFPIPTIAAIGGHAFAAGFTLALAHDYRVMNAQRGYLCMNEIEFGAPIPRGMLGAIQSVVTSSTLMRKIVLEGHRFPAKEALEAGLVDATADGQDGTLRRAFELAEQVKSRAAKNAWQSIKELVNRESLAMQFEPARVFKL
ncbi:hypothetical protein MCAP1_002722 [Malassezia caprae]|uniref:Uncharacterized protein n=1 Tax=Malassezia caprae TaxID=1381934 RepID=A0AAF0EA68_9BASI|nr:hypothetical protein MCAP1_002722 [Malassezia caprae]